MVSGELVHMLVANRVASMTGVDVDNVAADADMQVGADATQGAHVPIRAEPQKQRRWQPGPSQHVLKRSVGPAPFRIGRCCSRGHRACPHRVVAALLIRRRRQTHKTSTRHPTHTRARTSLPT